MAGGVIFEANRALTFSFSDHFLYMLFTVSYAKWLWNEGCGGGGGGGGDGDGDGDGDDELCITVIGVVFFLFSFFFLSPPFHFLLLVL